MKLSQLAAAFGLVIASGCFISVAHADNTTIDKVLGSAVVGSQQHYGDISLVNGSVKMASDSSAHDVSVVNGSIKLRDNIRLNSASTVNGSIESGSGLQVATNLETVNGKIHPGSQAVIGGNVDTVNGDILLHSSEIAKDISTVNGDITLSGNTVVKGDLVYKPRGKKKSFFGWSNSSKPKLHITADAAVEGRILLQQEVELQLDNPAMQAKVVYDINNGQ
ncbi:hypothetical protein [Rheinheimera maricola]|uniref:Polymer-forming cytoskeletal protein n=1 Tax=Rheinheimera maricola TaxID=2793282 RepID=A0ABS7XEC9_9GAMM|nr:hypothetical protein [Rheinheimera maricola]MBZ9613484.1 hypothetical protein [Rheinheimera maricola]